MCENTAPIRFTAPLESEPDSQAAFFVIPFDVQQAFGRRGRIPVKGALNGFAFTGSLFPYGSMYYLGVNRALREAALVRIGEPVEVVLELDETERQVDVPEDLAGALNDNPATQAAWARLSYSHRREYVEAINAAKKPETRLRRIEKTVQTLAQKEN